MNRERVKRITAEVERCAYAWEPDVKIIGNVSAADVVELCEAVRALEARAEAGGSGVRFAEVCAPNGILPSCVAVLRRIAIGGRVLADEERDDLAWLAARLQWGMDQEPALTGGASDA
ncbi:hypothetical protein [Gemmatimonas sp.]|uniref:hypothetical protein n=1 Tax=Gemmatimonas sp. TaxID=1962908 RepID=UPI0037BF7EC4